MELVADVLVSVIGVAVVGLYVWAAKYHFTTEKLPPGAKLIAVLVIAVAVLFVYLTWLLAQPLAAQLAGLALMLVSVWLFLAAIRASRTARLRAAFDEEKPHSFLSEGPYRHIRHPFYASYILFWVGWALAVFWVWAFVPVAILIYIYVTAARAEEARFAETGFAEQYAAHKRRAGLFWPRLGAPDGKAASGEDGR